MVLLLVSIFISEQRSHFEKNSAYECGFEQFNNALNIIDNQFYLVAILFLIFDLEITILFPWLMFLSIYGIFEYLTVLVFLLILTVGFIFE
jgi:NADH:ubiquinone oxidoreductase subunit 3 (subunit A)